MKKIITVITVVLLVTGMVFAGGKKDSDTGTAQTHTIAVGGSTSVTPLMELFQAEYEKANPTSKLPSAAQVPETELKAQAKELTKSVCPAAS